MKDKWARLLVDKIEYKKCKNDLAYFYNTYLKVDGEPLMTEQEIAYHKQRKVNIAKLTLVDRMSYYQYCYFMLGRKIDSSILKGL